MSNSISKERFDDLLWLWSEESEDPDTLLWRDELTPEEAKLVESWDKAYCKGVKNICQDISTMCSQAAKACT